MPETSEASPGTRLHPVRECDGCTLCCKVMRIGTLDKPRGEWCPHCKVGPCCTIYDERPGECRDFYCGYLLLPHLTEEWKPSKSKLVVVPEETTRRVTIHVDPARPDAWRREPFYGQFKRWAAKAAATHSEVVVMIGRRAIIILPDRDVDLGQVGDDELIVTGHRRTPKGMRIEAYTIRRDDPVAREFEAAQGKPVQLADLGPDRLRKGTDLA